MEQHLGPLVRDEVAAAARHNAHGELQPLGLVDAHHRHGVPVLGGELRRLQVRAAVPQLVQKPHKPRHPVVAGGLVIPGILLQQAQVGQALGAVLHGQGHVRVACFGVEVV